MLVIQILNWLDDKICNLEHTILNGMTMYCCVIGNREPTALQ